MKKILRFVPSIIWMGVIYYFSSQQTTGIGGSSYWLRFIIFKSFHIIEYAILSILIFYATSSSLPTTIIGIFYALSDELHQSFIAGRTATIRDIFFDITGIIFGLLILSILLKIEPIKKIIFQKNNK